MNIQQYIDRIAQIRPEDSKHVRKMKYEFLHLEVIVKAAVAIALYVIYENFNK
jgi:hypothetical protein